MQRREAAGFVPRQLTLYIVIVILSALGALAFQLRSNGIFACSAAAYSSDDYLAYCNSLAYGDFDHGAFWFGMEPGIREAAAAADALFLGSSRMEFGFSTGATDEWFSTREVEYYLLGFSHSENVSFVEPLLSSIAPAAKVFVINADRFFDDSLTEPANTIFFGDDAESRYRRKRAWQLPHRELCGALTWLCGDNLSFYRSRFSGQWTFLGSDALIPSGTADSSDDADESWVRNQKRAERFLATLPVARNCVLLTVVPWAATPRAEATALASALGVQLVAPVLDGLHTFDGSHLDTESAERWSARFFELAGDSISVCLREAGDAGG